MAIADDITVNYTRQTVEYTGGFTDGIPDSRYHSNELYSYLQDLFDEPAQMDDPVPISAATPTDYTWINGWFMDDESHKAFYGGAMSSVGWTKSGAAGVTQLRWTSGSSDPPTNADRGETVTGEHSGATGVILYADATRRVVWVRSTSVAQFEDAESCTSTSTAFTTETTDGWATGESLWSCGYTLGTIEDLSEIYIMQEADFMGGDSSKTKLTSWWNRSSTFTKVLDVSAGHIDVLVKVKEVDSLIDGARLTVFCRQYSKTYSHFSLTVSAGGRSAVPLSSGDDLNNTTGNRTFTGSNGTVTFTAEERIVGEHSGAEGVVTAVGGTVGSPVLTYYLIGKDLTDFDAAEGVVGQTSGSYCDAGAPANAGPALDTSIVATFGHVLQDINNGNGNRPYSVQIDCNTQDLSEVYERTKHLTRRGGTADIDDGGQTIAGEFYTAIGELLVRYIHQGAAFTEGETLVGHVSGATGIITSDYDTGEEGYLVLRDVKGTFVAGEEIDDTGTGNAEIQTTSAVVAVPAAPFGTFAGGVFFCARGVSLLNVPAGDAKNYQLTDTLGVLQQPPNVVSIVISGLVAGDRGFIAEVTGAGLTSLVKDQHGLAAANNLGDPDIVVDAAIDSDYPAAGVIRCVDVSAGIEDRYRYASWTGSTFTLLTEIHGSHTGGTSTTQLTDSAAEFVHVDDVEIGDLIYNDTSTDIWVITGIIDGENVTVDLVEQNGDGQWESGDTYSIHTLVRAYNGAEDTAYVPYVDGVATATELSNTLTYSTTIQVLARVRYSSGASPIEPYQSTNISIGSNGLTVAASRIDDTIKDAF
ncbi:MAG: hypothetical protein GY769_07725 [bacterium]|nr:hypothetical protein [bacterium]